MNGSASIIIIVIGLILLYLGITGKLDCMLDAWNTCRKQAEAPTGTTTTPTNNLPTIPTNPKDVYREIIKPPKTFPDTPIFT